MWLLVCLALLPAATQGETLAAGQVRIVEGTVSAVDVTHRSVVLEVNTTAGDLTVGVTLDDAAVPRMGAREVPLEDVAIGDAAKLTYTRRDGRLVGLELHLKP